MGIRSSCRDGERGERYPVPADLQRPGRLGLTPYRWAIRLDPGDGPKWRPCYRADVEATLTEPLSGTLGEPAPLRARWLGRIDYREPTCRNGSSRSERLAASGTSCCSWSTRRS